MYVQVWAQNQPPVDISGLREETHLLCHENNHYPASLGRRLRCLRLPRHKRLLPPLDPFMSKHLPLSEVYGRRLLGLIGDNLLKILRKRGVG